MNHSYQFPASFLLLQQEGYLISSCLATGLSELRLANVYNKGAFYSALFNLSVGIERLLKTIVIMEHMLKNNLSVPSKKQMKDYGHNIIDLYDSGVSTASLHNVQLPSRDALDSANKEILKLLSDFAQSTRYHNLDALSSSHNGKDPLAHWSEILISILHQDITEKKRDNILRQANVIAKAIQEFTFTLMQGLDRQPLTTEEALALPGLHDEAVKYAVLRIITILSPIRDLISTLSRKSYFLGVSEPPFPQMQEFLEWIWDDRQYVLRKKRWP